MIHGTNKQMGISEDFYKGDYIVISNYLEDLTHKLDFVDYNLLSVYSSYVDDIKDGFANGDCEDVADYLKSLVHRLEFHAEVMLEYAEYLERANELMQKNCENIQKKKQKELDAVY